VPDCGQEVDTTRTTPRQTDAGEFGECPILSCRSCSLAIEPNPFCVGAFCFVAVALGLVALATVLDRERATTAWTVLVLLLAVLCQDYGARSWAVPAVTGVKVPSLL
jgi:hypothetical protein